MKADSEIFKDVMDELRNEPVLSNTVIGLVVEDGNVTLYGFVNTDEKKSAANDAASRVNGVKTINDEVKVHFTIDRTTLKPEIA